MSDSELKSEHDAGRGAPANGAAVSAASAPPEQQPREKEFKEGGYGWSVPPLLPTSKALNLLVTHSSMRGGLSD